MTTKKGDEKINNIKVNSLLTPAEMQPEKLSRKLSFWLSFFVNAAKGELIGCLDWSSREAFTL
jgi:hypothetical protein